MQLTTTQSQIARDLHRFRVCCCGRRWGKTTLAIWEMFGKGAGLGGSRIVYIAPTYQQARDIAWSTLKAICKDATVNTNESRLELTIKAQDGKESTIFLRGWESVETLRGQRFDFMVIDEIAMMRNFWENWEEVLRPTLTDTKGEALFISTPKGFNHFYDLYNLENDAKKGSEFKSFHFTTLDNPFIPKDEIEKAKQEITEDRFAQEYMADFRKSEGLVYKEFSRDRHLFENLDIKNVQEYIAGVDFGFTNPTAVVGIKKDYDNNYWVVNEWYKTQRTEDQIADYVLSAHFNRVYPDPESPSAIAKLNERGIAVSEVIKNRDSVRTGINQVRDLFKQNKLRIHKSCTALIAELESYHYDEDGDEEPVKEDDHALDALRYAITSNAPNHRNLIDEMRERAIARTKLLRNNAR